MAGGLACQRCRVHRARGCNCARWAWAPSLAGNPAAARVPSLSNRVEASAMALLLEATIVGSRTRKARRYRSTSPRLSLASVVVALASCLSLVALGICHLPGAVGFLEWYTEGLAQGALELLAGVGVALAIYALGLRHGVTAQRALQDLPPQPLATQATGSAENPRMVDRAA